MPFIAKQLYDLGVRGYDGPKFPVGTYWPEICQFYINIGTKRKHLSKVQLKELADSVGNKLVFNLLIASKGAETKFHVYEGIVVRETCYYNIIEDRFATRFDLVCSPLEAIIKNQEPSFNAIT